MRFPPSNKLICAISFATTSWVYLLINTFDLPYGTAGMGMGAGSEERGAGIGGMCFAFNSASLQLLPVVHPVQYRKQIFSIAFEVYV
jgi:hypothetical protein